MAEGAGTSHHDTLHEIAERHALAMFKLGVLWAGIWIGGTEFTGVEDA